VVQPYLFSLTAYMATSPLIRPQNHAAGSSSFDVGKDEGVPESGG